MSATTPESSILPTYMRTPVAFEKGEGAWLTDSNGVRYLDFGAGIAVASVGHCHPHIVQALMEQGSKLWHVSNLYQIPQAERLAKRLTDVSLADFVFFTNSGAEAMEGAIKTARKYHAANGAPERVELITFEGAFHGRTLATIAAGGNDKYIEGFGAPVEGFHRKVPYGDIEAVKAAIGPRTAGIIVEPLQGEGGIRVASSAFFKELRRLCDANGILLVMDEVQSGIGRTGKFFAHERYGITPDIIAIAKGIGGGFPLGAFLTTREAGKGMVAGTHGTTYGGNPLATAVGNAVLDIVLADGFLANVEQTALQVRQRLAELQDRHPNVIAGIRGEGLMLGLCIANGITNAEFTAAAREERMLVIPAGENVVRLLPPLTIGEEEISAAMDRLDGACKRVAAKTGSGETS